MCGIAGFISNNRVTNPEFVIKQMTDRLLHRGPDSGDIWMNDAKTVVFGHRRLSIIDLSNAGSQPMVSQSGRYVIVFNGEIYNYSVLREDLIHKGAKFNSHSDTEVILAMLEVYGLDKMLNALAGMFAISIWDNVNEELILIRDRSGEKPLYYGANDTAFFFGSELGFIKDVSFIKREINPEVIPLFLEQSCIPAPYTIFKNIYKLLPGSYVKVDLKSFKTTLVPIKYWEYKHEPLPKYESFDAAKKDLDDELNKVVTQQMVADVKLGAFLSGGIDSSLITAIMQKNSDKKIQTFSIGFEEERFNEAPFAAAISKYVGTDHHEKILTNSEVKALALEVPVLFDEPFGDSSQIPTYLVTKFAKSTVTVSLSGDGGDELFGGYNKYVRAKQINKVLNRFPKVIRSNIASINSAIAKSSLTRRFPQIIKKSEKLSALFKTGNITELNAFLSNILVNESIYKSFDSSAPVSDLSKDALSNIEDTLMCLDFNNYLPNDILVKVDRMAMANSLESRAPFLDPRIIELSAKIPLKHKIFNGEKKWILKEILKEYIPTSFFDRPKRGFSVPLAYWFRDTSNTFVDEIYNLYGPKDEYLNYVEVNSLLTEHRTGKIDNSSLLWNIFVWYLWINNQN